MGDLVHQASIGGEGFQEEVQAGQAAAADAELLNYHQDDRMEDIMADFPAAGGALGEAGKLQPLPVSTQIGPETAGHDDRELELLKEKHGLLQMKAVELKNCWTRLTQISGKDDPYELLSKMYSSIDSMPDGQDKNNSVSMMNMIMPTFRVSRKNPDLRKFLADLYPAQDKYYEVKDEKLALNKKISMLTKLYNEQEKETLLANLQSEQAKREEDIKRKGQQRAATKEAKEAAKATAPKRQKTGPDPN
jgi:hypothetical protein